MKKSITRNIVIAVAVVAISGFGSTAFAGRGMGHGGSGKYNGGDSGDAGGPGQYHGACMGYGSNKQLDSETVKKLNAEREKFYNGTGDVRKKLFQKDLELRSELAKDTPDAKKAESIQKEISDLESVFARKRIAHMIEMKKINPDFRPGHGGKGRRGCGRSGNR